MRTAANLFFVLLRTVWSAKHLGAPRIWPASILRHPAVLYGYVCCRSQRPPRKAEEQRLDELLVHTDVGGVADDEGVCERVQGSAAPQKADGEGVAEDHRRDARQAYRLGARAEFVRE